MENRERICRLCLKKCVGNFKAMEENTKKTLDILLLKINLSISEDPVMCTHCAENIEKLFDFKSTCLYTQGVFVSNKDGVKLDLKAICLSEKESDNSIGIPKDHNLYGFCMLCGFCVDKLISCSVVSLDSKDGDVILEKMMLENCLPDLDLSTTKEPVICATCHEFLKKCFSFITSCGIVEENIKKYCEGTNSKGPIELNDVLQFTSKNILNDHGGDTCNIIKVEESFCDEGENANDEDKNENFTVVQKFNSELQFLKKNMLNWQEDDNTVETAKIERKSYEEIKNEMNYKKENFMETEDRECLLNEEIEIKTDQHDLDSFQDVVLPQPETSIEVHRRQKPVTLYQCEICSCQYKDKSSFKKHVLGHTNPSELTMYQCESCSFQTVHKHSLVGHKLTHKNPSEVTMYQCESCSYRTKHKNYFRRHNFMHKNPSKRPVYHCKSCSFQTVRKHSLTGHILTHKHPSEITMYQCESCSYQTKHKSSFNRHKVFHKDPLEITMHQCEFCSFQTLHTHSLTGHILTHKNPSEIMMYHCESCSFQTKHKDSIRMHMMKHKKPSEVTTYRCKSCSFQTKYKRSLSVHMVTHKDSSDVTIYQCDSCSFQTKYKASIARHNVIHKDCSETTMYHCESCSFRTVHKTSLRGHILTHKNPSERPMYQCEFCSFQTLHKWSLTGHILTHKKPSEITMYHCESCSFQTKYKDNIRLHMLKHKKPSEVTMYQCDSCSFQTKYKANIAAHNNHIHKGRSETTV